MSLYDLLAGMQKPAKKPVTCKRAPTKQTLAVVEILNINKGCEMETVEIARLAGLTRDTVISIMERLMERFKISTRVTTSSERRRGKHSKTKVRKWTSHAIIRL